MPTLTQEKQPYGRETRRELTIDGIHYAVRLSDLGCPGGNLERWELRRYVDGQKSGTVVDAFSCFPKDTKIEAAVERLTGVRQ